MKNTNEDLFKKNYQMLNIRQLKYSADSIDKEIDKRSTILHKHLKKYIALEQDTLSKEKETKTQLKNDMIRKSETDTTEDVKSQTKQRARADVKKQNTDVADTSNTTKVDSLKNYFFEPHPDSTMLAMIPLKYKNKVIKRALDNAKNSKGYINVARRDIQIKGRSKNKYHMEWHRKFVLSIGCIMLFFIGAPLGAITRKGGLGLPMILSIAFFVLYHLLNTFGKKLSEEFVLSPFYGMWLSTILLTPVGIFLTYKALNDSNIINLDVYVDWFRKRFQQLGWIKREPST